MINERHSVIFLFSLNSIELYELDLDLNVVNLHTSCRSFLFLLAIGGRMFY